MEGESTFELEKSGLTNEYDFGCAELPASTKATIGVTHTPAFDFDQFGFRLAEFINLGLDLNAALTASATVTTIHNENKVKTKYEGGQDWHKHKHKTNPLYKFDINDTIGPTGVGSREINNAGCVFGGIYVKMICLMIILMKISW